MGRHFNFSSIHLFLLGIVCFELSCVATFFHAGSLTSMSTKSTLEVSSSPITVIDTTTINTHGHTSTSKKPNDNPNSFEEAYQGCDTTWGCFGMTISLGNGSMGCEHSKSCDILVTYTTNIEGDVDFTMLGNTNEYNYIALGITKSAEMKDSSVMFCYQNDGRTGVGMSWNNDNYQNLLLDDPSYGLSKTQTCYKDKILRCKYIRKKITNIKIPGSNKNNDSMEFDLSQSYHLLMAVGNVAANNDSLKASFPVKLDYHASKVVSNDRIDLNAFSPSSTSTFTTSSTTANITSVATSSHSSSNTSTSFSSTSTSTSPSTSKKPNSRFEEAYNGCGKKWGCFGMTSSGKADCETSKSCTILVTFTRKEDGKVNFTMIGNTLETKLDSSYIAFGLSDSMSMATASVMFCYNDDKVTPSTGVGMSWNNDQYNSVVLDDPSYGLTKTSADHVDGILSCSYTRDTVTDVPIPGSSNKTVEFDLTKSFFLLLAGGHVSKTSNDSFENSFPVALALHTAKVVSEEKVLLNISSQATSKDTRAIIQAHGCLMVLAWILFANIGMFTAKFCKKMLPRMKIFGADVWFRIHQLCMSMVITLSMAGASILWVDRGVEPLQWDNIKNNPHSALGMAAICIGLIQPVIAFFRPSPDHKYRIVFKLVHKFTGYIALTIAGVGMYFATKLDEAMLDEHTWIILLVYGQFCLVSSIILGVYVYLTKKRLKEEFFDKIVYGGYIMYIMVIIAFVFAMFLLILNNSPSDQDS